MGEHGTLRRLSVQYRGMDAAGQLMYCNGVVTGKRVEGGEHLAECDIWTEKGSGERTTRGSALVALPARPV